MPDAPVPSPAKTDVTASGPGKAATRDSGDVKADAPVPTPAKSSP